MVHVWLCIKLVIAYRSRHGNLLEHMMSHNSNLYEGSNSACPFKFGKSPMLKMKGPTKRVMRQ